MLEIATIFQPLVTVFGGVLKFFHNNLGVSWGWSIVLLTVCVRALMLPLTVKQFHSMQKLQRLSPELKRIQAKYKEDKQRQQQELMKLYQEHGVNPFASCLPLVLQLPVFIGLYYTLRTSLRGDICPSLQPHHIVHGRNVINTAHTVACNGHGGSSFLFIHDLTSTATGATLVALIVLYVGSQLLSQVLMSTPQMDKTQRYMMMALPLVFVFIMIGLPTGVMVYWITTNLWTIGQQYFLRRRLGPMTPLVAGGTQDGGAARGGGASVAEAAPAANGAGGGGLGALLRGRPKVEAQPEAEEQPKTKERPKAKEQPKTKEREPVGAGARARPRTTAPPPPPRKKKKRSGRRR